MDNTRFAEDGKTPRCKITEYKDMRFPFRYFSDPFGKYGSTIYPHVQNKYRLWHESLNISGPCLNQLVSSTDPAVDSYGVLISAEYGDNLCVQYFEDEWDYLTYYVRVRAEEIAKHPSFAGYELFIENSHHECNMISVFVPYGTDKATVKHLKEELLSMAYEGIETFVSEAYPKTCERQVAFSLNDSHILHLERIDESSIQWRLYEKGFKYQEAEGIVTSEELLEAGFSDDSITAARIYILANEMAFEISSVSSVPVSCMDKYFKSDFVVNADLKDDIKEMLLNSISTDYIEDIFDMLKNNLAEDVIHTSSYLEDGGYNSDDIKLSIGRVLFDQLRKK